MALTDLSAVTEEFVDLLSAELLLAPDPQYVFAQLARGAMLGAMGIPEAVGRSGVDGGMDRAMGSGNGTLDLSRFQPVAESFVQIVREAAAPGTTILIDRPEYIDGTVTEVSRRLTEATAITTTGLALGMGQVSLTVREYGGPYDTGNTRVAPISLAEFTKRRAKHDLLKMVGLQLRRDRNRFLDRVFVDLLLSSSNITLGSGEADEANMTEGGNPLTEADLAAVKQAFRERNIPAFPDGFYMLVIAPAHETELRQDPNFREIVRYCQERGPLMQGHIADYAGFHIVSSNTIPTDAVGAGAAVTARQAIAFGPNAVGWGEGLQAQARRDRNDDYGRVDKVIWLSHETFGLLDEDFVQVIKTS